MRTRITESSLFMGIGLTLLSIGLALWMTGCGGDLAAPTTPRPVEPAPAATQDTPKPTPEPVPVEDLEIYVRNLRAIRGPFSVVWEWDSVPGFRNYLVQIGQGEPDENSQEVPVDRTWLKMPFSLEVSIAPEDTWHLRVAPLDMAGERVGGYTDWSYVDAWKGVSSWPSCDGVDVSNRLVAKNPLYGSLPVPVEISQLPGVSLTDMIGVYERVGQEMAERTGYEGDSVFSEVGGDRNLIGPVRVEIGVCEDDRPSCADILGRTVMYSPDAGVEVVGSYWVAVHEVFHLFGFMHFGYTEYKGFAYEEGQWMSESLTYLTALQEDFDRLRCFMEQRGVVH